MSGHIQHTYAHFGDHTVPPPVAVKVDDSVPDYMLEIRQQPQHARVALGKDKADRKPIDPPPILQLKVSHKKDPMQNFLQSPYFFMSCSLLKGDEMSGKDPMPSHLIGTVVSSLHRLKDTDNQDGGFFVFGDLSCKVEGKFRLLFTLFQMQKTECVHITSIVSAVFQVYPTKSFPGLAESTFLTRSFSDQGVRLRLRKDSRSMTTRKRNATAAEFARKHQDRDSGSGAGGGDSIRRSMQQGQSQGHGPMQVPVSLPIQGRASSGTDDGLSYGSTIGSSAYDSPHTVSAASYGHYDSTDNGLPKRRRLVADDVAPPPLSHPAHAYTGAVTAAGPGGPADLGAYGAPRGIAAYSTAAHMGLPVGSSAPYGMPTLAQTALAYGHAPHTHHQLNRIDTQHLGGGSAGSGGGGGGHHAGGPGSAGPGAFPSPSSRQSPHTFQYGALQASPSSMGYQPSSAASTSAHSGGVGVGGSGGGGGGGGMTGSPAGDYRPHAGSLYTSSAASAGASPRTHPTPNPNHGTPGGASTSPPDASAAGGSNYTAAAAAVAAAAAGPMTTSFSQSISPYSYAHALGDPQSHLPPLPSHQHHAHHAHQHQHQQHQQHQHQPLPTMATTRSNGLPALDLQHVNGGGLGLDMSYADMDHRHNHGQAS